MEWGSRSLKSLNQRSSKRSKRPNPKPTCLWFITRGCWMSQRSLSCLELPTKFSRRIPSPRALILSRWDRLFSTCLRGDQREILGKLSLTLLKRVDLLMTFRDSSRTKDRNNFLIWSLSTLSIASARKHALRKMQRISLFSVWSTLRAQNSSKPSSRTISQMPWNVD